MAIDKRPIRIPPHIVPTELVAETFVCGVCKKLNSINWFEKQDAPKESFAGTTPAGGFWVPASFRNSCSECGADNEILAPSGGDDPPLLFYGDEAERTFFSNGKRLYYFCLAIVATTPNLHARVLAKMEKVERNMRAASDGRITYFHAKEIMSHKNWPPNLGPTFRLNYIRRICKAAAQTRVSKFVVAGCAAWKSSNDQKLVRDQVFTAAYMYILNVCRKQGIVPVFHFDRVKNGTKNGWAEECILGLRYYPLFVWMARRAHIL